MKIIHITLLACIVFISCNHSGNKANLKLTCEETSFGQTPQYQQTITECKMLCDHAPWLQFTIFGKSLQNRDLPLLIADIDHEFTPEPALKKHKLVILIQACIHPGEPEGKDAGLLLLKNFILSDSLRQMLNNTIILFIPIFNVDGHERFEPYNRINQNGPEKMGWRTNANNLNLNRDFMKAESPEMQAWLKLYNQWRPHIFIDCHTTDGADYQYPLTYSVELNGNLDEGLTNWLKTTLIPAFENYMQSTGMPVIPYTVFRNWHDPRSGLITWVSPPALSTGYATIQNRIGFLIETHMLKDYKTRVMATLAAIKNIISTASSERLNLLDLIAMADEKFSSGNMYHTYFDLTYKLSNESIKILFKGKKYSIKKSSLTGGDWFHYSDTNMDFEVAYYNKMIPDYSIQIPLAYLVPVEYVPLVEPKLKLHGIDYQFIHQLTRKKVKSYRFSNVKFSVVPVEGRQKVISFDIEPVIETREYLPGSIVIPVSQSKGRIVMNLFEPKAPDSFVSWGFLNSIFEQKEYAETYVMEKIAREMLASDSLIRQKFDAEIKNNPRYINNQWEMLNWFYNNSLYRDAKLNMYPFGIEE